MENMENMLGLVMTGGGARGAYQAGVLKRIGEIKRVQTHGNPFPIIGGTSAGAHGAGRGRTVITPRPSQGLLGRPSARHEAGQVPLAIYGTDLKR